VVRYNDKEPGRAETALWRPLIVDTLDLPDRNLRPGMQRGRTQSSGPVTGRGGDRARPFRDRWSASATNGNSAQVTFARVSTRVNSPGKIESGHGPVSITVITVRRQRTRSNPERCRNEEVSV